MVAHLLRHEIRRSLRPARVLPLLGVAMIMSFLRVHGPWRAEEAQLQGALTLHGYWLSDLIPLVAGAAGGSLAADRQKGLTLTLLARGVSRGRYLLSKLLGAAASSALITLAAIGCFYVIVALLWPAGRATWPGNEWTPGPVPALYRQDPLAHDLLVIAMCLAAAAALSQVGVLAGALVASEYAAIAAPPLFTILASVALDGAFEPLSPHVHLNLWGAYTGAVPTRLLPCGAFLYWSGLAALTGLSCGWILARKELS